MLKMDKVPSRRKLTQHNIMKHAMYNSIYVSKCIGLQSSHLLTRSGIKSANPALGIDRKHAITADDGSGEIAVAFAGRRANVRAPRQSWIVGQHHVLHGMMR